MSVGEMLAHLATHAALGAAVPLRREEVGVAMEDFGRWMGEAGAKSKALTAKAHIVDALKSNGEAFATALEA